MRKIILLIILTLILSFSVLSFGAVRTVSGDKVTLTIDTTGGSGVFTIQETLVGATVTSQPNSCGYVSSTNRLTCNYDLDVAGTLVYDFSGTGTVSGVMSGRAPGATSSSTITISPATTNLEVASCTSDCTLDSTQCNPFDDTKYQICVEDATSGCTIWRNDDCSTGEECSGDGVCGLELPTCLDGTRNGDETDVDCGGPTCSACAGYETCKSGTDCVSENCNNGRCLSKIGEKCVSDIDCESEVCTDGLCAEDRTTPLDIDTLIAQIRAALENTSTDTLVKLSEIAHALRGHFNP